MGSEVKDSTSSLKIDKDFLTSVLGSEAEIISFQVSAGSKPGDNYVGVLHSIDVQLKTNGGSVETKNLLLKCFPSHPARQQSTAGMNVFYRELQVYQTWLPELNRFQREVLRLKEPYKLPFTHAVAGRAVDFSSLNLDQIKELKINHLENFIVMEDLRKSLGFVMPNRKVPLNIHQLKVVVTALAQTHAIGWAYKNKVTADIPQKYPFFYACNSEDNLKDWVYLAESSMVEELKVIEKFFGADSEITKGAKKFQPHMKNLVSFFFGKDVEELCHRIMRIKTSEELPKPWKSIIHGDCWSSNVLFRYDSVTGLPLETTLIDLQLLYDGCITIDMLMIIYCGTTTEFRKNHLEELLHLYVDTFMEVCRVCDCPSLSGFTFESFKERFHRGKVLGLLCGLMVYPMILGDDSATVDLETMDESKDFGEMLQSSVGGNEMMNPQVTERVLELVQEMYDEGII